MKKTICLGMILSLLCILFGGCAQLEQNAVPPTPDVAPTQPVETPQGTEAAKETEESIQETPESAVFEFDTVDLEGNAVNTREFAAQYDLTLVNFWATWCGPCVSEMPELQSLNEEFSAATDGARVGILGVWLDTESRSDMEAVLDYTGARYPMVEFQSTMQNSVALQYIPATIFLDKEGAIVGDPIVGAQDAAGWRTEIQARLAELGLA